MAEKKNEIVVQDFNLMTITGDMAEAIAEEMDGLGPISFDRVKIPSGGGLAFELPGEDDETPETAQELVGVILDHHPVNAYWADKYSGGNEQPDCSSFDGKTGVDRETGEIKNCDGCPYNKFGSDNAGKACKNVHRCYILREGNPVPLLLALPPTSLKPLRDYIAKKILLKGMRCWQVLTKITLKKEKNANGIVYSRAVFSLVGPLTPEQVAQTEAMKNFVKTTYRQVDIDSGDYTVARPADDAPKADENGFVNVPEGDDAGLPFN